MKSILKVGKNGIVIKGNITCARLPENYSASSYLTETEQN